MRLLISTTPVKSSVPMHHATVTRRRAFFLSLSISVFICRLRAVTSWAIALYTYPYRLGTRAHASAPVHLPRVRAARVVVVVVGKHTERGNIT